MLSVSSSRADAGILAPVWRALCEDPGTDLHIVLTGMHLAASAPPVADIPSGAKVHRCGTDIGGGSAGDAARAMGRSVTQIVPVLEQLAPDVMLVVGDRFDMLPAVIASLPFNCPVAHLHGGEITEGAIDDRIRHAISKLAHVHCVSCRSARANLLAMGEADDRIAVTGAPGLDTVMAAPQIPKDTFLRQMNLPAGCDFRLVTVHPETNSPDPHAPLNQILKALNLRPGPTLFTAPNSDPGGSDARARIMAFAKTHDWANFVDTLGSQAYPNALRHAACMIGNSSSGIIEAGLFGLPVVNVGDRQKGRERGRNVIDVANDAEALIAVLDGLGASPAKFPAQTLYGDGHAGKRVAAVIRKLPEQERLVEKRLVPAS